MLYTPITSLTAFGIVFLRFFSSSSIDQKDYIISSKFKQLPMHS